MSGEIERSTLQAFITPEKRSRYLALLDAKRGRPKLRALLAHPGDLDKRFIHAVPPSISSADELSSLLRRRGAPQICYVMSELEDIDGREMDLKLALSESLLRGLGMLISCLPGRLGYYQGELAMERYILERML